MKRLKVFGKYVLPDEDGKWKVCSEEGEVIERFKRKRDAIIYCQKNARKSLSENSELKS